MHELDSGSDGRVTAARSPTLMRSGRRASRAADAAPQSVVDAAKH